jgi:hypothetical protein
MAGWSQKHGEQASHVSLAYGSNFNKMNAHIYCPIRASSLLCINYSIMLPTLSPTIYMLSLILRCAALLYCKKKKQTR